MQYRQRHESPMVPLTSFISKLEDGDNKTTGQGKNYQTLSNLHFRHLLKNVFQSINIDLTDMSCEKYPLYKSVSLVLFYYLEKPQHSFLT